MKFVAMASLAAAWMVASAGPASASIILTISISGSDIGTITSGPTDLGSNSYSFDDTNFAIFSATGVGFQIGGNSNPPGSNLVGGRLTGSQDAVNTAALSRTITITVNQSTPYTLPGSNGSNMILTSTASSSNNPAALVYDTRLNLADQASQTPPSTLMNSILVVPFVRGANYTLGSTTVITLASNTAGTYSETAVVTAVAAVPEPATLALALAGLPLLAIVRLAGRRRRA